jgi:hypothetical protein
MNITKLTPYTRKVQDSAVGLELPSYPGGYKTDDEEWALNLYLQLLKRRILVAHFRMKPLKGDKFDM